MSSITNKSVESKFDSDDTPLSSRLVKLLVSPGVSIKEALKSMDAGGEKILFVTNENYELLGTLTDGDIRRWLIQEGRLDEPVSKIYKKKPLVVDSNVSTGEAKNIMRKHRVEVLPVLNNKGILKSAYFWSDLIGSQSVCGNKCVNMPVIIMAGGKGSRLNPFTKILPKPLIPIGEKPIVETIMDYFSLQGCDDFFLTINYKGKMIQSYFENSETSYKITLIWEDQPLGTAGSLSLMKDLIKSSAIFVTNCDVIIKADYADIQAFHEETGSGVTLVASMQHTTIPYGVIEAKSGGELEKITEKPEFDYLANTGFYIVNTDLMKLLPEQKSCDFPEFLDLVKKAGKKVSVYPISQRSWIDAGQWTEYQNAVKELDLS